jgi:FkbM family methyltransferase
MPTLPDALESMLALGVNVASILDVGVRYRTEPLMRIFPDLPHHLFEPITDYADEIKQSYSRFDFELHNVALSDTDGQAWQLAFSSDGTGNITYSQISDQPHASGGLPHLIDCRPVRKARLDSFLRGIDPPAPYLLKIDVDGHEIPILAGASDALQKTAVVVIEMTAKTFLARAQHLATQGFSLFDIVDLTYYNGTFYQADVLFLPTGQLETSPQLRPKMAETFDRDAWYPLSSMFP